jgi:phage-related protein
MSYTYGGLTIPVVADTKGMRGQITGEAQAAGNEAAKTIGTSMNAGLKAIGGLGMAVGKSVATGLGVASAAAIGFGVASFRTAARVGEMDASLRALAKANNLSYTAMQNSVKAVKAQGIETGVAQTLVAQFARNQLDLSKATRLATVAQDAAVISGRNSTEVLDDLVHGITTQNSLVLRNAGLNVQAGQAMSEYAKSVGKSTAELTDAERAQAVLNATLKSGETVAGAYAEAMKEPGKVLRSFPRLIDDIKVSVGQGLVKALGPAILGAYDLAKALAKAVEPGGVLGPIFDAIGVAVGRLVAPVTALVTAWAEWIANLKPDQIARVVDVIKQFGPAAIVAGAALASITGAGVLGGLPIIGTVLSSLLGPLKALGPLFSVVGKAAFASAAGMSGAAAGATGLAKAVAIATGPIGWIVAAVVAVTLASAKFRTALLDVGKALISGLTPVLAAVVGGFKAIMPPIMDVARALGDVLGPILTRLAPLLQPIGALIGGVLVVAFGALGVALKAASIILVAVFEVLGRLVEMIPVEPIRSFSSALSSLIGAAAAVLNPLNLLRGVLDWLGNAISSVVRWIFGGSPGLIPAFVAAAAAAGPLMAVLNALAGVFQFVASAIAAAWSAVTSSTAAAWSAVTSLVSSGAAAVRSVVSSAFSTIRSTVSSAMSAVASAVSSGMASARSAASSASSAMVGAMRTAASGMVSAIRAGMNQVAGAVRSGLASAVGAARAGGAAIMQGLQAGINSAAGAVMSTISSVAGKISGALSSALKIGSPSRLTIPMGRDLFRGLEVGYAQEARTAEWEVPHLGVPGVTGSPLGGPVPALGGLGGQGAVINVYPTARQDEREIAAMVSRELAWATAAGTV